MVGGDGAGVVGAGVVGVGVVGVGVVGAGVVGAGVVGDGVGEGDGAATVVDGDGVDGDVGDGAATAAGASWRPSSSGVRFATVGAQEATERATPVAAAQSHRESCSVDMRPV